MTRILMTAAGLFVLFSAAYAQPATAKQANPLSDHSRMMWGVMSNNILIQAAERMPEEHYVFKPADAVRNFGQLVGHLADAQNMFCSLVMGEKNPSLKVEETKRSKADLIAALKDARSRCDRAYNAMTDSGGVQTVKIFGGDMPKFGVLSMNLIHSSLHYGNMVTYMRMKNIVPPSTEPGTSTAVPKN